MREAWERRAEGWRLERRWPRVVTRRGKEVWARSPVVAPGRLARRGPDSPSCCDKRPLLGCRPVLFSDPSGMPACPAPPGAAVASAPPAQPAGAALPFALFGSDAGERRLLYREWWEGGVGSCSALPSCLPQPSADLQPSGFKPNSPRLRMGSLILLSTLKCQALLAVPSERRTSHPPKRQSTLHFCSKPRAFPGKKGSLCVLRFKSFLSFTVQNVCVL